MQAPVHTSSTTVGFRRNIKWFLSALVGFLITLILILLLFLQTVIESAVQREDDGRWVGFAAAKESVEAAGPSASAGSLEGRLFAARNTFGFVGIELTRPDGTVIRSGYLPPQSESISRTTSMGTLVVHFPRSNIENLQQRFLYVATIVLGSTAAAVVLLVLLMPRIVRPIERMLEDARELGERDVNQAEDSYLIETFRSSIARLREQEQELRRLHEFEKARADDLERITSTLTRSLSSGFIALDPDGRVVDLNRSAREILGLGEHDSSKDDLSSLLGDGEFSATIARVFESRQALTRHELVDDRHRIIVGLTTVPLYGDHENFLGMLVLFTDLSRVRELEQRMREMQALADLGQISAGIAHEFRNSLGTIFGYLKLARRQTDARAADEKMGQAEAEGHRLADSINALLAFAKPVSLELETIDIPSLLRRICDRLTTEIDLVEMAIHGKGAEVEADVALLETAFENLLRNAIESIPAGVQGRVEATVEPNGEEVSISIQDTGTGIDEELLPRVFLPFQTGKASGTGLGLALARKIVLLHGGSISISSSPGEGTEVQIELPRHPNS